MSKEKINFIRKLYRKLLYRNIDKIYENILSQKQKPKSRKKFLDVGCGFGFNLISKIRLGYGAYGVEIDKDRIAKTKFILSKFNFKTNLIVADAQFLPFKRNSFDFIASQHLIEHLKDDKGCLKQVHSILKRNGKFELIVPNKNNLYTKTRFFLKLKPFYTDRTHFREYEKNEVTNLLKEVGFKDIKISERGFFPPFGLKFYFLLGNFIPPLAHLFENLVKILPQYAAEFKLVSDK